MIEGTTTKSLGITLRTLYPGAFASYQGVIFRVIAPGGDTLSGVTPDTPKCGEVLDILEDYPQLAQKAFRLIRRGVERDTGILLPERPRRPLIVIVPSKVDLRIDDTLEKVYCTNSECGTIWKISYYVGRAKGLPRCKLCGSRLQQAPIFIPVSERNPGVSLGGVGMNVGSIQPLSDRMLFCHYKKPNGSCTAPTSTDHLCVTEFNDQLGSLQMMDPQRPVNSLMRTNPDCPKNLHVPPIDITRPQRTNNIWYSMDFPRESLTAPLTASSVESYDDNEDPEIQEVNDVLKLLLGQFFNAKLVDFEMTKFTHMKILETVYGYRLGNRMTGFTTSYLGISTKTVLGRVTNTKGFQITIKPEIYDTIGAIKIEKSYPDTDEEILEVILHSLKHALLVLVPIFTGLDENKFHGTYEINDIKDGWAAKVYVYDTEDGGSGGFSTIIRNQKIFQKMLDEVRLRRLHCPVRECKLACKHCLYIRNCGFVNRRLNRKLLIDSGIFQTI